MSEPVLVRCIDCVKLSFKRCDPAWARLGFGACDRNEPWIVFGATKDRDCQHFACAEDDVVEKRKTWLKGQANG